MHFKVFALFAVVLMAIASVSFAQEDEQQTMNIGEKGIVLIDG